MTNTNTTKMGRVVGRIGPAPERVERGRASLASHPLVVRALEEAQAELEAARMRGAKLINAAFRKAAAEVYPGSDRRAVSIF
jgi:alkylation response protein AidB-like acyl-CoA dehydrogenase